MIGLALGALAGVLFGLLAVLIRVGLSKGVSPEVGAAVGSTIALALVSVIALVTGSVGDGVSVRDVLVFGAVGVIVPGLSSIVFVRAIGLAGAARAAVGVGAAPLLSFVLAVVAPRRASHLAARDRRRADRRRGAVPVVRSPGAGGVPAARVRPRGRLRRDVRDPRRRGSLVVGRRDRPGRSSGP